MNQNIIFVKNIPKTHDFNYLLSYFVKHGQLKLFKPVYDISISYIRFIWIEYKEQRSLFYFRNSINCKDETVIDFHNLCTSMNDCQSDEDVISKCNKIKLELQNNLCNTRPHSADKLYFENKKEWEIRVKDIDNLLKDF